MSTIIEGIKFKPLKFTPLKLNVLLATAINFITSILVNSLILFCLFSNLLALSIVGVYFIRSYKKKDK